MLLLLLLLWDFNFFSFSFSLRCIDYKTRELSTHTLYFTAKRSQVNSQKLYHKKKNTECVCEEPSASGGGGVKFGSVLVFLGTRFIHCQRETRRASGEVVCERSTSASDSGLPGNTTHIPHKKLRNFCMICIEGLKAETAVALTFLVGLIVGSLAELGLLLSVFMLS